jgi:hypothetical protein
MRPEWLDYWQDRWEWMEQGGYEACIWYLRNCVDLSDFKPGAPPPVTEFLRDITEASKSSQLQTMEAFIAAGAGSFKSDLVTASDAVVTLKCGEMIRADLMYAKPEWFTPVKVGLLLREMPMSRKVRVYDGKGQVWMWIIRNHDKYDNMSGSEIWTAYQDQMSGVDKTKLALVAG